MIPLYDDYYYLVLFLKIHVSYPLGKAWKALPSTDVYCQAWLHTVDKK